MPGVNLPAHPHDPPTLANAAPAWFQPAMTAIMAPSHVMLAQTQNYLRHDGSFTPFTIVPFNDGSMPTQAPHNLPPLVSAVAIRALTAVQSTDYAVGYALGNVGAAPSR